MLWLLYAVYLIVRSSIDPPSARPTLRRLRPPAFLDVPLVYLRASSPRRPPRLYPADRPDENHAPWFVPVTLIAAGLILLDFVGALKDATTGTQEESRRCIPAAT